MSDLIERLRHRALARVASKAKHAKADAELDNAAASRIAALEAQLAEAKAENERLNRLNNGLHDEVQFMRQAAKENREALSALEATPPAPKVTEEMVDAALAEVRKHPRTKDQMAKLRSSVRRQIEAALTAAQEAGKP